MIGKLDPHGLGSRALSGVNSRTAISLGQNWGTGILRGLDLEMGLHLSEAGTVHTDWSLYIVNVQSERK